jgi:tetratricopeptide (TPR) repeat protein
MLQKIKSATGTHLRMPWWLFWSILLAVTWFYLVRRVISWDLWWHMAAGRHLVDNGAFWAMLNPKTWIWGGPYLLEQGIYPDANTFTFSEVKGANFISKTWLGDIIFHLVYSAGGFYGLQILRAVFMLIPVLLTLHLTKWKHNIWTLLGCSLLIIGTMQKHLLKNAIVVLPLMAYISWAWVQIRFKGRWKLLLTLPFVFSFWSHFHGSAIVGINFLLVIVAADAFDSLLLPSLGKIHKKSLAWAFSDLRVMVSSALGVVLLYSAKWWFCLGVVAFVTLLCCFDRQTRPFFDSVKQRAKPKLSCFAIVTLFVCSQIVTPIWTGPLAMAEKTFSSVLSTIFSSSTEIAIESSKPEQSKKQVSSKTPRAELKEKLRFLFKGTDADMVAEYQWPFDIPYVLSVQAVFMLILFYFLYLRLKICLNWQQLYLSIELPCLALIVLSLGYLRTVSYSFLAVVPLMAYSLSTGFTKMPKRSSTWIGIVMLIESIALVIAFSFHPILNFFFKEFFGVLGYTQWLVIPFLFASPAVALFLIAKQLDIQHRQKMGMGVLGAAILFALLFKLDLSLESFSSKPSSFSVAILFCPLLVAGLLFLRCKDFFKRATQGFALGLSIYSLLCFAPFIHYENNTYRKGDFHSVSGFLDTEPGLGKSNKFFDGMADYVLEKLPENKTIYNTYNMGGYLQWKWYGKRKVFIDGRSIIFDNDFYQAYTKNNAQAYIKKHDFEHAIINMLVDKDRLKVLLQQGWTPIAFDPGMTVLQRSEQKIQDNFGILPAYQEGERPIPDMENLDRQALGNFFMETLNHMMFFGRIKDGKAFMENSMEIIEQLDSNPLDERGKTLVQQLKNRSLHVQKICNVFGEVNHEAIGPMCRKILLNQSKGLDLMLTQGQTHYALSQWEKAEQYLIQSYTQLKKDKDKTPSPQLLSMIGHTLYEQKKLDRSLAAYQEAINANPKHAGLHNAVMLPLLAKKDFQKAILVGQKAIALNPKLLEAYVNLGAAWLGSGQTDKATQVLQTALKIQPDFEKAKALLKRILGS